jgi:hypothetical protein
MQRSRRRDPYPLTWEVPLALTAAVLLVLAGGVHLGRAVANLLAGAGWALPARAELFTSLPGPGAAPTLVWVCVTVTELALLAATAAAAKAGLDRWGPGRLRGMASRGEAEQLLGLSRLRKAAPVVRPDLYGPGRPRR